ncbi:cation:proton antiporter [uncultured Methanomethylovorans sp.]|uniref:cation:proton antiporter domain-containing protein n=1 Tax=uncultured Methanomethylovorans sp. TaxID=183759 RepID=UPI002AA9244D|nr:cation:proton antiporter [uncultured Methanomethylovorans sp.]
MEDSLLTDINIIFGMSIFILLIFYRLRIPLVVGFLLTGIIVGPHGLGAVTSLEQVETVSDIGVILLMFTIGAELSLRDLWEIKRSVLIGGSLQVVLTIIATYYLAMKMGMNAPSALFIGFLISLSSTAIVLKQLQERSEIYTPQGSISLAILIFQDIVTVPMILLTPVLAGSTDGFGSSLPILLIKAMLIISIVVVSARTFVPYLLYQIAKTRNRELFLLSIVFIGLTVAWITAYIGLSLALGAFLAGLIISESEYSHQALGNLMPFKDMFMSFFFVSIGMLLDIHNVFVNFTWLIYMALVVLLLKATVSGAVTYLLGYPFRTAILVGLALGQVGEFSFVLSKTGLDLGLLDSTTYQSFLAVSIITMGATSIVIEMSPRVADMAQKAPHIPERMKQGLYAAKLAPGKKEEELSDHAIIVGFGFNGKTISKAARASGIPYVILEMNPDTVKKERAMGENICFGDATQYSIMQHVSIAKARVIVIGISDPLATRKIIDLARKMSPNVYIIARTRFLSEMGPLYQLGADEVVTEEYETSIEVFARLMERYLVPRDQIEKFIDEVRADGYKMLRSYAGEEINAGKIQTCLPGMQMLSLKVERDSYLVGKAIAETGLRKEYGVTLLAIQRKENIISNPDSNAVLEVNDLCILLGSAEDTSKVRQLFKSNYLLKP